MDSPSSSPLIDPSERDDRARQVSAVVYEFLSRKNQGEPVELSEYESRHPALMPELRVALQRGLNRLRNVVDGERAREEASGEDRHNALPPMISEGARLPHDDRPRVRGYRLVREISGGGQGAVYEAVQEITGRTVALKVITAISRNAAARFEREVQALATVNHPGVVGVIDRGRTNNGSYYLAMEYVDGEDLDHWLASRRGAGGHTQQSLVRVFAEIAAAAGAAHRKDIVHRDLKPSNIRIDRQSRPKIVDFGLAHLMQERDAASDPLTLTGNIVGSIPWASPEQADGRKTFSPASDVYSLGVLLYQAMTGSFPYEVAGPLHAVTYNICRREPVNPTSVRKPAFGAIDRTLASILLKCLAKTPADRFPDGVVLAETLDAYLKGSLADPRTPSRLSYWASGAVASIVLLAAALTWNQHKAEPRDEVLVAPLPRLTNIVGLTFVRVPPGKFHMGSPPNEVGHQDEEQSHLVEITRPFYIATTEVTRGQYRQVMKALPATAGEGPDDLPITHVSWDDATRFCEALSKLERREYALPTEAQWEYACRAGTTRPFAGAGDANAISWNRDNSGGQLHAVAGRSANHWGIYDMQGNAAEWVLDRFVPYLGVEEIRDPVHVVGDPTGTIRGGSYLDPTQHCRAAARTTMSRAFASSSLGFRIAIRTSDDSQSR